jgi:hypothetical protein
MDRKPPLILRLAVLAVTGMVLDPVAFAQQPAPAATAASAQRPASGRPSRSGTWTRFSRLSPFTPTRCSRRCSWLRLSPRDRGGRPLAEANATLRTRRSRTRFSSNMGPEREGAHRRAAGPHHDEREARLDDQAGRRIPRAAGRNAQDRADSARQQTRQAISSRARR